MTKATLNGTLFFLANDPRPGNKALWSSNGTAGGHQASSPTWAELSLLPERRLPLN